MRKIISFGLASALLSGVCFSPDAEAGAAPAAPTAVTKTILKQNGIKRPDAGSITGALWDIADALSEAKKAPASRKEVVDKYMADVPNANQATANTQYARWVTYHGVSNVLRDARAAETAARQAEKVKASEAAAAEKEAKKKADADAAAAKKAEREAKAAEKEAEKKRKADERAAAKAEKDRVAAEAKAAKEAAAAQAKAEADAQKATS